MGEYNIGDVWWIHFPYGDIDETKRRPAIIIDDDTIAILAMYVTSKNKETPYSIELQDWELTGLTKPSWTRIDKIVRISEWYMSKKIGELSTRDRTKIMQLVAEFTTDKTHDFSLLAIRNNDGKYLQKYDSRWGTWLFPYIRSTDMNKENIDSFVKSLTRSDLQAEFVSHTVHCKYSVSDNVYKIYHHKLYKVMTDVLPEHMLDDTFSIDKTEYKWMSFKEIEEDDDIMDKNEEIVAFIKSKCGEN